MIAKPGNKTATVPWPDPCLEYDTSHQNQALKESDWPIGHVMSQEVYKTVILTVLKTSSEALLLCDDLAISVSVILTQTHFQWPMAPDLQLSLANLMPFSASDLLSQNVIYIQNFYCK